MAYVIGHVTKAELELLRDGGWEISDPPKKFKPDDLFPGTESVMVYVDVDLYELVIGEPDGSKNKNG